ncbi:hypothetical protein ACHQM5_022461 [Ranunculus cassubicifolius]
MVVNERPLKRIKLRVTADLNDFLTFPEPCSSTQFLGPFRLNIRSFLSKHGYLPPPSSLFPRLLVWQIMFRIGELSNDLSSISSPEKIVTLDVIEEDVQSSRSVYCDQCRVIGWSGHPVCTKRYHFIIRSDLPPREGYQKWCTSCGDLLIVSDFRCKSCNNELTDEDLQDWVRIQLEDTTHLLHGVVHGNGYGHLLRVNGREGGSKVLSGCDIMGFWDRLCDALRVRKVSVMDVSKKYGLEYRLLHAITNGRTWYGNWGFEFGAGSFALTLDAYKKAVECLSGFPLSLFFQARESRTRLQDVITFYQALSESQLSTIRELFCFLLELIRKSKPSKLASKTPKSGPCSSVLCSWTIDDIDRVQQSMIKVLQVAGGSGWVPWRALKGAAFRLASSELLDYCLKVLDGKVLDDGRMVLSRCNPDSDAIEYRLITKPDGGDGSSVESNCPSKEHILRDLDFLYCALLNPLTMGSHYRSKAIREQAVSSARKLLDCKQFLKEYTPGTVVSPNPSTLTFSCQVELIGQKIDYTSPPPEVISLPLNATITDLKTEAAKAFQDAYLLFKWFHVEELLGYGGVDDASQLKFLIGSSCSVRVLGKFLCLEGVEDFRMERGVEIWTVNCICGAKDDDGERMLACDTCGLWQHTRCVGVNDLDPVPDRFFCLACKRTEQQQQQTNRSSTGSAKTAVRVGRNGGKSRAAIDQTRTLAKTKKSFYQEMESPTRSWGSDVIDSMDEDLETPAPLAIEMRPSRSSSKSSYKHLQDVDVSYSSKLDSPNPSSGTTSEEINTVLDTCSSSKTGIVKTKNCFKYNDEDAAAGRIRNGLKIRFIVR